MKKILFVANTDRHIILCHIPYLRMFKERGYEVSVATNTDEAIPYCNKKINLNLKREPFKISNFIAIFKLKKIIDKEKFDIIHVHTPTGEIVGRLASIKARQTGTKVFYTAHGLHFFKGCNPINYLLFYPIESYLMKYTDVLITMNNEDLEFSKKHFKVSDIRFIHGIGYDYQRFSKQTSLKEQEQLKKELNITNEFVISYIAEISKRKRQTYLLNILSKMDLSGMKILLVGENRLGNKIYKLIEKYKLADHVSILGFRKDVNGILDITDLVISVSSQEGLPLNIAEALYKKKCILATKERGISDLIRNSNGILVGRNDKLSFQESIYMLKENDNLRKDIVNNIKDIDKYSIHNVIQEVEKIYSDYIEL